MLLFKSVKEGKSALSTLASDWLEVYVSDNGVGLTELVKFVIQSCGCNAPLSHAVLTSERGIVQAIQELTQGFDEESGEYPLIMNGPLYKRFRNNFSEFIERIISCCQQGPLYDELLLPGFLEWLVGLADSQVRAFRHTCTLACLKVSTSLANIAKKSRESLDKTQRQLEAEKGKQGSKRTSDKQKTLERSCKEQEQRLLDLEEALAMLFSSVFVHRYKDIFPDIRALCIAELGTWMRDYSCFFLQDKYLKYIGWTLYDKVGEVRLRAVESLHYLYENSTFIPMLQLFTDRFKNRLVSMVMDKDDAVAVQAVKVCRLLLDSEMLNTVETEYVCSLVFVENRAVAQAATEFLLAKLFSQDEFQNSLEDLEPSQITQARIRELLMFYMAYGVLEHGTYFVDALWGHTELLKDWAVMTDLLLEVELSEAEENFLIELLTCSALRAAGGAPPPGRFYKRIIGTKEKKIISTDRESMTVHMCQFLPGLLHKYSTDKDKVISLLSIANSFELKLYVDRRFESHYSELLDCLYGLINKHSNSDLINQVVSTLNYLTTNELAIRKTGEVARNKLIDEVVTRFKDFFSGANYKPIEESESESGQEAEVILTRLKSFYLYFNLTRWSCFSLLLKLLHYSSQHNISTRAVASTIYCTSLHVYWVVASLSKEQPDEQSVKLINEKIPTILKILEDYLVYGYDDEIRADAFLVLSDLITILSPNLINHTPAFKSIVVSPSIELQESCTNFVLQYVFTDSGSNGGAGNSRGFASDEQDGESERKLEHFQKKREVFAAFTRLIIYGSFPMVLASRIFVHYLRFYDTFGSMMKLSISKCKEASQVLWSKTILQSLKQLFEEIRDMSADGQVNKGTQEWSYLKELAKRFNLLTGFELGKIRKIVVSIHIGGIEYALKPNSSTVREQQDTASNYPNMEFLDVVQEFLHKLLEEDRLGERGVKRFLDTLLPPGYTLHPKRKQWSTLNNFVNIMLKPNTKKQPLKTPMQGEVGSAGSEDEIVNVSEGSRVGTGKRVSGGASARGARGGRSRGTAPTLPTTPLSVQSTPISEQVNQQSEELTSSSTTVAPTSSSLLGQDITSPILSGGDDEFPVDSTNWMDEFDALASPRELTSTVEVKSKKTRQSRKRPSNSSELMDSETPIISIRRSKRINLSRSDSEVMDLLEPEEDSTTSEL